MGGVVDPGMEAVVVSERRWLDPRIAASGVQHRAWMQETEPGKWMAGCDWCRTTLGPTSDPDLGAWASGHDSAVACQRDVARRQPPTFRPTGPGEATSLAQLRDTAADLIAWFGDEAEVLVAADQSPLLYVFTPPTEEGWNRELLATVHVDNGAIEVSPRGDEIGGDDVDEDA